MLKKLTVLFIILGVNHLVRSQGLSLSDAISVGMENNFAIRTAKNLEKVSIINSNYAFAAFLPVIDVTGARNFDVQNVDQQFRSGDTNTLDGAQSDNLNIRGDLTWTVFDGTKMFFDYQSLQIERNKSRFETQAVLENTLGSIIQAYFQLVFEQYQYKVLESAVELSEARLKIAQDNFELGRFSKTDLLSAQVDLNTDKSNLLNQGEILQQANVTLNQFLGQSPNEKLTAIDTLIVDKSLKFDNLLIDLQAKNKQLLALMQQEDILSIQNKIVYTELLPQIDLNAGYGYNSFNSQAGFLLQNQAIGLSYGLSLSWRIFNRMDRLRRNQTTQIDIDNNSIAMEELENQLVGELSSAYVRYQNKIILIELEKANVEVAEENAEIAIERYKVGRSNAIELREFQLNSIQAKSRLLNAIFLAKQAEVNLMAISGNLLTNE